MGIHLKHGNQAFRILRWGEKHEPEDVVRFSDAPHALEFLLRFTPDPPMMLRLRDLLAEQDGIGDLSRSDDRTVLERLSTLMASGRATVVSAQKMAARPRTSTAAAPPVATQQKAPPAPLPAKPKPVIFITFKVVDDESGKPLPGVKLKIKLTNGQVGEFTTDWTGMVDIRGIPRGACDIQNMSYEEMLEVVEVA